ncbi:MAG: histidine triad nucleotide-binding protein [Candidatus Gracilibacteria bacterium]|jgi:histidine triad (HIT) family protein|nr:histidine triad nucleotide-binding protein [Candidatus Gracilibacteria bacterium]
MQDCIFCKIVRGDIPSKKFYEDEQVVAFHDINPCAKTHFLVVPKKHIRSMADIEESDRDLIGHMMFMGQKLAKEQGLKGWKMLFNVEKEGGQVVFHIHLHVLGGGVISLDEC